VLGDGSTQLNQFEYNTLGKATKTTDPVGRVMSYVYDTNGPITLISPTTISSRSVTRTSPGSH
jgi:YD repeat-containing protein